MSIAEAIRTASEQAQWPPSQVATAAGVVEASARRWMSGASIPPGDKLELLRRNLPGLKELLDGKLVPGAVA